jgi:uncharacterized damage-inducible protein DinB
MLLICPMFAQDARAVQEIQKHWKTSKDFTLAVAAAMPEDSFSFKPSPEEMGYGEVIEHFAVANAGTCARVTGDKSPISGTKDFSKANIQKLLTQSFDYCLEQLEKLKPEQLGNVPEGRTLSQRESLWNAFTHTAHHRGQLQVYLRVKGIKPPEYRF